MATQLIVSWQYVAQIKFVELHSNGPAMDKKLSGNRWEAQWVEPFKNQKSSNYQYA